MIILLAADHNDAARYFGSVPTGVKVLHAFESADISADVVEPGARIHRTDRWLYDDRIVSALQALHARIGLVDPTGLLGPVDRREGARSTKPWGTPPVGGSFEADTRSVAMRRRAGGA